MNGDCCSKTVHKPVKCLKKPVNVHDCKFYFAT